MNRLSILLVFFAIAQTAVAYGYHDPRTGSTHTHDDDYGQIQVRTWKYEDKRIAAEGTFLLARAGKVFIEKEDGVVSFAIESLSWVDQKYVNRKLKEIEQIASARYLDQADRKAGNISYWVQPLTGSILFLSILLTIILLKQRADKTLFVPGS